MAYFVWFHGSRWRTSHDYSTLRKIPLKKNPMSFVPDLKTIDFVEFSRKYFKARDITFSNIVGAGAALVEKLTTNKTTTSEDKLRLAKDTLPYLVDAIHAIGWINDTQSDNYKQEIQGKAQLVEDIIELAVDVANNPNLIQAGQWIKKQNCCKF
jgi:hypothetical protein